jgi:hypothetical protein
LIAALTANWTNVFGVLDFAALPGAAEVAPVEVEEPLVVEAVLEVRVTSESIGSSASCVSSLATEV